MIVELLYVQDCPSHDGLLRTVQRLADEAGAQVRQRRIETQDEAVRERFLGSPTVRVNGTDVDPSAGERTDYGLGCRIYRLPGRGLSADPPQEWIQAALDRPPRTAAGSGGLGPGTQQSATARARRDPAVSKRRCG
jgi:hypothetical protein